jgi:hypothetical protein
LNNLDDFELVTPFQLHGNWWRAGHAEDAVAGVLSYTPEYGLELTVYGDFSGSPMPRRWDEEEEKPQPIWGEGTDFVISLFNDIRTNLPNDPDQKKPFEHTIYNIGRAVLGTHCWAEAALKFKSIRFSVLGLEVFANTYQMLPFVVLAKSTKNELKLKYKYRPTILAKLVNPAADLSITTTTASSFANCTLSITYQEHIALKFAQSLAFEEATNAVFTISNFFQICAHLPVETRFIKGTTDTDDEISLLSPMRVRTPKGKTQRWLMTVNCLGTSFQTVINNWFALVKKLSFIGPVYFTELATPSPVTDARFLHLAGCLEAYHDEVYKQKIGQMMSKNAYQKLVKNLMKHLPPATPPTLAKRMQESLNFANSASFAQRLDALFQTLEPETKAMLANDPPRFLESIKHSRNKLAHVSSKTAKVFKGREYAHANFSLRAWLTMMMLKECGISEAVIRNRMNSNGYLFWGPFEFDT